VVRSLAVEVSQNGSSRLDAVVGLR
jgi:hypothetical protein